MSAERIGDVLKGKYRIDALLGSGGMGEVYRAWNTLVDRTVAIKVLRAELASDAQVKERFMREAKAANVVRHRHIVDVLDIDSDETGAMFIVQEYLEGEDLAARLEHAEGRRLPVAEALAILVPVASAVGAAHARGLVHRDLKPDNVFLAMLDEERVPKVLDFGISKIPLSVDEKPRSGPTSGEGNARLTAVGIAMGTPAYMSPEQIRDPSTVDARTDVWALGVILYESLTGTLPFDGDTIAELFVQICTTEPVPLDRVVDDVSPELSRVVWRCLRPAPAERYADARELSRALMREAEKIRRRTQLGTSSPPGDSVPPRAPSSPVPSTSVPSPMSLPVPSPTPIRDPALAATQPQMPAKMAAIDPAVWELDLGADAGPNVSSIPPTSRSVTGLSGRPMSSQPPMSQPMSQPVVVSQRPAIVSRAPSSRLDRPPMPIEASVLVRLVLGLALGLAVALATVALAGDRIVAAQQALGAWAFVPFVAAAVVVCGAAVFILVHAARQVSYLLFAASLGSFTVAASSASMAALLAAPGLVPQTLRRLLLTVGPWGAAVIVVSLSLVALLHALELRREGPGMMPRLLLGAALLGFGATLFVTRAAMVTPRELVELSITPADAPIARRARQLGLMLAGARAVRGERIPSATRSTRGGEAAAAALDAR